MKRLLLAALLLSGCAPKHLKLTPPSQPQLAGVMHLIGAGSFGHACPVDGVILSAAHIVRPIRPWGSAPAYYAWENSQGQTGFLRPGSVQRRDIGRFFLTSGNPAYYNSAKEPPGVGDRVHWCEYEMSGRKNAFSVRERSAKVVRLIAGHIIFDEGPTRGASGGCLLNDSNEVVGLPVWSIRVKLTETVGVAVSVWGKWFPQFFY